MLKSKAIKKSIDFIVENLSVLATLGATSYVVFRQSNAATKLPTDDLLSAVVGILGLLALSEFLERYNRLKSIEKYNQKILGLLEARVVDRPSADAFFQKLPDFESFTKHSQSIDFCGVSLTSTLNRQLSNLRDCIKRGGKVRILIIDPQSDALQMADLRSEVPGSGYCGRKLDASFNDLNYLWRQGSLEAQANRPGKIEIRLLNFAPSFGIYAFDVSKDSGHIFIEIYPHITGWGSTPSFELIQGRDAHYYNYFSDQFEALWERAKDWQPTNSP